MSTYDKNHYSTVISLQLIKMNEKKYSVFKMDRRSYMWNLERNDMNELTYKRLTEKEFMVARGKG